MKQLFVAATIDEAAPLIQHLHLKKQNDILYYGETNNLIITGIGLVATAIHLTNHLSKNHYDACINIGIAGSFIDSFSIGTVVSVQSDRLIELGKQTPEAFIPFTDNQNIRPYKILSTFNYNLLPQVNACTVNTVTANLNTKHRIIEQFNPAIETMEGATFFLCCNQFQLPALQIRSISNYVNPPHLSQWNKALAIETLNDFLISQIK